MSSEGFDPASFRDRDARVFHRDGEIYRALSSRALEDWRSCSSQPFFRELVEQRKIVRSAESDVPPPAGQWAAVLRHEQIPFISYPYEWPFSMLRDAALLHLEILDRALAADLTLKDATAYNIQWTGALPAFIDVTSFERQRPGDPWAGYRQFCQHFLYPLFLQVYRNVDFQPLLRGFLDGIPAAHAARMLTVTFRDLLRRGIFAHVYLAAKAERAFSDTAVEVRYELQSAGFGTAMIRANLRGLTKTIRSLQWRHPKSTWSSYAGNLPYSERDVQQKRQFVDEAAASARPQLAWDLGCNNGEFSRILAARGAYVVAVDVDHVTVDRLYRELREERSRTILPLVLDLADPSSDRGWAGRERASFLRRGRRPDLILALALVHHLCLSGNVPMAQIIDLFAEVGGDLVIEFVHRNDPMVERLLRNKRDNYADYDQEAFELLLREKYSVVRRLALESGTRTLYFANRR